MYPISVSLSAFLICLSASLFAYMSLYSFTQTAFISMITVGACINNCHHHPEMLFVSPSPPAPIFTQSLPLKFSKL